MNLQPYTHDGLELVIDQASGESYASASAIARMMSTSEKVISTRQITSYGNTLLQSLKIEAINESQIVTGIGLRSVKLYNEKAILEFAKKYNVNLLDKFAQCGLRVFLHGLAGYKVTSEATIAAPVKTPGNFIEALELALKQAKELELAEAQIQLLVEANERQAEVIDELFDYSSIIRIAKFNNCSEKNFNWWSLKAASEKLGVEIKRVPCPRFDTKNLYSHDAWRLAYPEYKLPETTTLRIG
jgi:hypothetical protein